MERLNKIQQALKAPKGQRNDFAHYNYRSCEDILEAVKPLLGDATLTVTDEMVAVGTPLSGQYREIAKDGTVIEQDMDIGSRIYVKATATLKCGEESESATAYAREPFNKKGMDEAQITGATSSYARKYALNGLFAIDDAKDADSTNKHGKEEKKENTATSDDKMFEGLSKAEGVNMDIKTVKAFLAGKGLNTAAKVRAKGRDEVLKILRGDKNE